MTNSIKKILRSWADEYLIYVIPAGAIWTALLFFQLGKEMQGTILGLSLGLSGFPLIAYGFMITHMIRKDEREVRENEAPA